MTVVTLELCLELEVEPLRLACLALEGTDLPFHFANQVPDAQEILLGVFQLPKRLAFLCFEFSDAGGFFKNHPPVFRFAGENLCDVPLRHDAVARAPHAGAHEKLLNVLQAAGRPVYEVLTSTVTENPPRDGQLVVSQFDSGRLQMLRVHLAHGQRDFGHAQRFATVRAVENHVSHLSAAQRFG